MFILFDLSSQLFAWWVSRTLKYWWSRWFMSPAVEMPWQWRSKTGDRLASPYWAEPCFMGGSCAFLFTYVHANETKHELCCTVKNFSRKYYKNPGSNLKADSYLRKTVLLPVTLLPINSRLNLLNGLAAIWRHTCILKNNVLPITF